MCSYNTFCGHPPEIVKKMPKKDLAEEVFLLFLLHANMLAVLLFCSIVFPLLSLFFLNAILSFGYDLILRQVWRLQAALGEQIEITKFSQHEYERLQNVMLSPSSCDNYHLCLACTNVSHFGVAYPLHFHVSTFSVFQEKVLCRVCFEREISVVLLPCRHRVLCR